MRRESIIVLVAFLEHTHGWQACFRGQSSSLHRNGRVDHPAFPSTQGIGFYDTLRGSKRQGLSMTGDDFWAQQRAVVEQMTERTEKSLREEQLQKFAERRTALIVDTAFFAALIFSFLWLVCANPFVSFSYSLGAVLGLAYAYGLGKYVETIGGNVDDTEAVQGAGVGQARFAFLILLFVIVGKYRSTGLLEIPTISGFFTYQLASLSQGLREIND